MIDPLTYFWLFLKASLFSTGGTGNLPSIHADLLARHWATEEQFAEALAIGQVSPGPSGLWVIALGYLTNGLGGALMATLAISIPPMVVLLLDRLQRRLGDHPAMLGFTRGLGLAVSGNVIVIMALLLIANGLEPISLLVAAASIGLGLTRRVPVVVHLALAGVAGVLLF